LSSRQDEGPEQFLPARRLLSVAARYSSPHPSYAT
jgi:hypothetical protein